MTSTGLQLILYWYLVVTAVDSTGQTWQDVDEVTRYHERATCSVDQSLMQAQIDELIAQGHLVAEYTQPGGTTSYSRAGCKFGGEMSVRR